MKIEFSSNKYGYHGVGLVGETFQVWFQTLPRKEWHFGRHDMWYDGPIGVLGFGFCEFQWYQY